MELQKHKEERKEGKKKQIRGLKEEEKESLHDYHDDVVEMLTDPPAQNEDDDNNEGEKNKSHWNFFWESEGSDQERGMLKGRQIYVYKVRIYLSKIHKFSSQSRGLTLKKYIIMMMITRK